MPNYHYEDLVNLAEIYNASGLANRRTEDEYRSIIHRTQLYPPGHQK